MEFFTGSFTACPLDIVSTFEPNACGVPGDTSNYIFICSGESACASSISPSSAVATTEVPQMSTSATGATGTATTEATGTTTTGAIGTTTTGATGTATTEATGTTTTGAIGTTTTGATGTATTEATGTGSSGSTSPTGDTQGSNTSDGSSKFSSPSAVAGYAITGLIVASIGVCIAWCQLRIAQKNRREKNIARSI